MSATVIMSRDFTDEMVLRKMSRDEYGQWKANEQAAKERAKKLGRPMKCIVCGEEFLSPRGRTTCSDKCKKAHKYEQNKKRTPEHRRHGAEAQCVMCGKSFLRATYNQRYCSVLCQTRGGGKYAAAKAKTIPAKCCICGADFMTSQSARARTCGKPCTLKLRSQLAKARDAAKKQAVKDDRPFNMPCPWQTGNLDTLPPGVASWDCPEMDPMSGGFPMITFNAPVAQEVAA